MGQGENPFVNVNYMMFKSWTQKIEGMLYCGKVYGKL